MDLAGGPLASLTCGLWIEGGRQKVSTQPLVFKFTLFHIFYFF